MKKPALVPLALTLPIYVAQLSAEEPAVIQPSHTVGSVYGNAVTAADIGLTAKIDATDINLFSRAHAGGGITDRKWREHPCYEFISAECTNRGRAW